MAGLLIFFAGEAERPWKTKQIFSAGAALCHLKTLPLLIYLYVLEQKLYSVRE